MRAMDRQGSEIRLPKEFVKHGIRKIAEDRCTQELGYRTQAQALEAQRREVSENRYTAIDRIIARADAATAGGTDFLVNAQNGGRAQLMVARLAVLKDIGLARRVNADAWEVRGDFGSVLRGMQNMADRQRTLAASGVLRSDERLPIHALDHSALVHVEGRILVHGEEESGRRYMMLESTDARVYVIKHTQQMQEMRQAGGLRVNTFVRLRKVFAAGRPNIEVEELGTAESVLENRGYLRQTAQQILRDGITSAGEGWQGWLGSYQRAVNQAVNEIRSERDVIGIER